MTHFLKFFYFDKYIFCDSLLFRIQRTRRQSRHNTKRTMKIKHILGIGFFLFLAYGTTTSFFLAIHSPELIGKSPGVKVGLWTIGHISHIWDPVLFGILITSIILGWKFMPPAMMRNSGVGDDLALIGSLFLFPLILLAIQTPLIWVFGDTFKDEMLFLPVLAWSLTPGVNSRRTGLLLPSTFIVVVNVFARGQLIAIFVIWTFFGLRWLYWCLYKSVAKSWKDVIGEVSNHFKPATFEK